MNSRPKTKQQILTPNQAAEILMVEPATVRQWAAKGKLHALVTPGGHRRFRMSDIKTFAQQQGITLNIEEKETLTILVVDDNVDFTEYLQQLLPSFDERIKVEVAQDGFEAGKLVHIINPDMILMDLHMPTMDGFEACKNIKQNPQTAQIRIICMTGYASGENIQRIMGLGAEACLKKPINELELEQYVAMLFD